MVGEQKLFDREAMAKWYAQRHLKTDEAIVEIYYLPAGAPPNEIRLIEVNNLVSETTSMEPVDFGVDIGEMDAHSLYVLDVTPKQWEAIRAKKLPLPDGWILENSLPFGRKK